MEVDVGVVTYNSAEITARALEHLAGTDHGCQIRLLVHDNGSTDGTAARVQDTFPGALVNVASSNLGFAAGVNALLERSGAEWFLALNSDAWPAPGAIGRLVEAAEAHPRAAAVAPRIESPDGRVEDSTHPFPSVRVAATLAVANRRWPTRESGRLRGYWAHESARDVDWAVGAALLLRRRAVDEIGGFDERFFMYAEDLEWCWRARQRGWTVRFEPAATVVHVGNASGGAVYGDRRTRAYLANTYRFLRRTRSPLWVLVWRVCNLAGCLRQWAGARQRGDRVAAAGWAAQVKGHLSRVRPLDEPPEV